VAGLQQQQQQQLAMLAGGQGGAVSPAAAATAAAAAAGEAGPVVGAGEGVLDAFSRMLYAVTHYSKLQPLAYVPCCSNRTAPGAGGAQILSSVEFDCYGQLFAAAGEAGGWPVCMPGCCLPACMLSVQMHA
jgi:hypothetical protein